ncbi:hypothetical protein M8C21_023477, partial [Ambrosia artemisiifolia]
KKPDRGRINPIEESCNGSVFGVKTTDGTRCFFTIGGEDFCVRMCMKKILVESKFNGMYLNRKLLNV